MSHNGDQEAGSRPIAKHHTSLRLVQLEGNSRVWNRAVLARYWKQEAKVGYIDRSSNEESD